MSYLVRSACLTNFESVARAAGLDARAMIREAGLGLDSLSNPEKLISAEPVCALLESAAARSGVADFGLRMAQSRRTSNLGVVGLLWKEEPTLRKAILSMSRYLRLHNEGLLVRIEDWEDMASIHVDIMVPAGVVAFQAVDLTMAVFHQLVRATRGDNWRAEIIGLTRPRPRDTAPYERYFGQQVAFEQEFNAFVCSRSELDAVMIAADPELASHIRQLLDARLGDLPKSFADRVRQRIRTLLPLGRCSVERVADTLGMDRRTVHRHLLREGVNFSTLLDDVRADLAALYLASGDRSLAEVAEYLDFSGASALSRWFRGHFGQSPRNWQAARHQG
ncbi:MAG: AraC family transcriptional regulator [Hyphomicrobiales bacterium]|nr:AraC family transcriptional regulator [Hyphomicrobiales bacterium]